MMASQSTVTAQIVTLRAIPRRSQGGSGRPVVFVLLERTYVRDPGSSTMRHKPRQQRPRAVASKHLYEKTALSYRYVVPDGCVCRCRKRRPSLVHPALRSPKGATVALVIFEDLECPDCARAAPLLEEASRTYKIPVVRHDFPLPMHPWAYDAAILARYFDTHSKAVGERFPRHRCSSTSLRSPKDTCGRLPRKYAASHKIDLPFVVDPTGSSRS